MKILTMFLMVMQLVSYQPAWAETMDVNKLADAIYLAEGGAKTRHPYGILKKYKTTTPRQACVNTINHALKDWDGQGDFIRFLGAKYCPISSDTDDGTCVNWIPNTRRIYGKIN